MWLWCIVLIRRSHHNIMKVMRKSKVPLRGISPVPAAVVWVQSGTRPWHGSTCFYVLTGNDWEAWELSSHPAQRSVKTLIKPNVLLFVQDRRPRRALSCFCWHQCSASLPYYCKRIEQQCVIWNKGWRITKDGFILRVKAWWQLLFSLSCYRKSLIMQLLLYCYRRMHL